MTIENITVRTCTSCNGTGEIIRAGIRTDCTCDAGVIVQAHTDIVPAPLDFLNESTFETQNRIDNLDFRLS